MSNLKSNNLKRNQLNTVLPKDGKFFTVVFTKRTTGELRTMNCRLGVKKHLKGGQKAFNDTEKQILTVWDAQKKAYRSIPLENVNRITVNKNTYNVID